MARTIYNKGGIYINIDVTVYEKRLKKAQKWLANQVIKDSEEIVPLRTGRLRKSVKAKKGGKQVTYNTPYARYVYEGVRKDGRPIRFRTPGTMSHWYDEAYKRYGKSWIDGARRIIIEGK